jgi:hypothetical protein
MHAKWWDCMQSDAMQRHVIWYSVTRSNASWRTLMLRNVLWYNVMLCDATWRTVIQRDVLHTVMLRDALWCNAMRCNVTYYDAAWRTYSDVACITMWCNVTCCDAMWRTVMQRDALWYNVTRARWYLWCWRVCPVSAWSCTTWRIDWGVTRVSAQSSHSRLPSATVIHRRGWQARPQQSRRTARPPRTPTDAKKQNGNLCRWSLAIHYVVCTCMHFSERRQQLCSINLVLTNEVVKGVTCCF